MIDVLLIANDQGLITEIQKITAVTGCKLKVTTQASPIEVNNSSTVLIDANLDISINHHDVVLITAGKPGTEIWQRAVATGAKYVAFLPDAREWLIQNLIPKANKNAKVIGVIGASGGIGASLLASLIATDYAKSKCSVLLTELSKTSGGLDVLWGIEDTKGLRWSDLASNKKLFFNQDFLRALPTSHGVAILSTDAKNLNVEFGILNKIEQLQKCVDVLVIDLANPENSDFAETLEFCDELILVVGSTIRSVSAANQLKLIYPKLLKSKLVVRNLSGTGLAALNIAKTLDLKLAGEITSDLKIVEQLEQGISPAQISTGSISKAIADIRVELNESDVSDVA